MRTLLAVLRAILTSRAALVAENLALRQQLAILRASVNRPELRSRGRVFWVWLSRLWPDWKSLLVTVQPDTATKWHRQGFKLYGRWHQHVPQSIRERKLIVAPWSHHRGRSDLETYIPRWAVQDLRHSKGAGPPNP